MGRNSEIIDRFCSVWSDGDIDRIMGFFAPNAVYVNVPIDPPNEGVEMIRKTIEGFLGMAERIEFVVHHQAESSTGTVLNERTDRFLINGRWVEAGVMGVFELEDGKITHWRDYFDMGQFQSAMAG